MRAQTGEHAARLGPQIVRSQRPSAAVDDRPVGRRGRRVRDCVPWDPSRRGQDAAAAGWALGAAEEEDDPEEAFEDSPPLEELSVLEEFAELAPEESLDAVEAPAVEESVE